ncbi:MAG: amidohydrolase family protein [Eubacteriales bacterium]|nr:amidohydrolase family protein [Eubacteriales bacterium]
MIDVHSYIINPDDDAEFSRLMEDMTTNHIDYRVISVKRDDSNIANYKAVTKLCSRSPKLLGCAFINPRRDDALTTVRMCVKDPSIRMFEFDSYYNGYYPERQENLKELFQTIAETDKPIKVFVGLGAYSIPQQWELWAERYPSIPFIFLHMGCFDYGYTCIDVVQRNDNIYTESSNQYELQILRKAAKNLDVSKILFGTTYPHRLSSSGILVFDMTDWDDEQKEKIFNNGKKLLKIEC